MKRYYYRVYSGRPEELEAGYYPHLEAVFKSKEESVEFVNTWLDLYPKGDVSFWYENPD